MKICKKCGADDRYPSGGCKPCYLNNQRKYRENNTKAVKANRDKWQVKNAINLQSTPCGKCGTTDRSPCGNCANCAKSYLAKNNDKSRIYHHNYMHKSGTLSYGLCEKLYIEQHGLCACCAKPLLNNFDMDHWMPLALGGKNIDSNIQLLTKSCNRSKHDKHPHVYAASRNFSFIKRFE